MRMRTKNEICTDIDAGFTTVKDAQLEVLFDIREMLKNIGEKPVPVHIANEPIITTSNE